MKGRLRTWATREASTIESRLIYGKLCLGDKLERISLTKAEKR